jgi:hypothetical protein
MSYIRFIENHGTSNSPVQLDFTRNEQVNLLPANEPKPKLTSQTWDEGSEFRTRRGKSETHDPDRR